jgi:lipoyl synthase
MSQDVKPGKKRAPKPEWLRTRLPKGAAFCQTSGAVAAHGLRTVCRSANCPNIFECFSRKTATFLILGGVCTRDCAFCNIEPGAPEPVDPSEPERVAMAAAELDLSHVVVTSVTRDDLPDGGAAHFAAVIRSIRRALPKAVVETLIPDFKGDETALGLVFEARPDILNHNVETAPELYARIRPQADYAQSLELLRRAARSGLTAKSGLMAGLGESDEQIRRVTADLAQTGCSIITIGQYLQPTRRHPEPARYVHPDLFEEYAAHGRSLGVKHMFCAPLVRSSYHAELFAT